MLRSMNSRLLWRTQWISSRNKVSMASIKALRERTGAPIKSVKEALEESDGDSEQALDYLRKLGASLATKRSNRVANDGLISIAVSSDHKRASMIELSSETDFVARTTQFTTIANDIAHYALHCEPSSNSILDEILERKETTEQIEQGITSLGEKIELKRASLITTSANDMIYSYMHRNVGTLNCGKIGVLVHLNNDHNIGQRIAMHIAASNPKYLNLESIPSEHIEKERNILLEAAITENQQNNKQVPEKVLKRMIDGRLNKWYTDTVLSNQEMLVESDGYDGKARSVAKSVLAEDADLKILKFIRYEVGNE